MARKVKSKRSLAAKKGWETRRANARSRAAKKGWETRRANALLKEKQKRKKKKRKKVRRAVEEYQINVRYPSKISTKVEVQIAAIGPPGMNRDQILSAVDSYLESGNSPKGWQIHIAFWKKGKEKYFGDDEKAFRNLKWFMGESEIETSADEEKEEG